MTLGNSQKWVPGGFPGGKGGRCVRLTTLPWNLGTLTSWNPLGHSRPVTGLIYFYLVTVVTVTILASGVFILSLCHARRRVMWFRSRDISETDRPSRNLQHSGTIGHTGDSVYTCMCAKMRLVVGHNNRVSGWSLKNSPSVCFLLGYSPASEFYVPTFRNTLFHLHRQVGSEWHSAPTCQWRWNWQGVPKSRYIKFRRRGMMIWW